MEKGDDDRISALPDCLLIEIVSGLQSTKDAIRTGTLSKRWQHIWAWVPTLIFRAPDQCYQNPESLSDLNPKPLSDFALSVDKTLTQCRQLKLKKFELQTVYEIRFESLFNKWIRYAISCNVKELSLQFWGRETEFLLDQFFLINSCFTDLRLQRCKFNPSAEISWENLRSLHISWLNVDEDLIVNIVSGSPLLETLVLEYFTPPYINAISTPTSNLSLTQCRQLKQFKKFEVTTSYDIQFQSQLNNWILYAIRCNVKDLHLGFLTFGSEYKLMLDQVFFNSSCFTELRLHGCMLNSVGAIIWENLRSLCICDYKSLDEGVIENILSGSPVLETLELYRCYGYRRLDITSKSVKNLLLFGYKEPFCESKADIIEINAPYILSLKIESHLALRKLLLVNVSSLVKANLHYFVTPDHPLALMPTEAEQEMLKGFIMKLRHVKELEIGCYCSKVLYYLQAKGFVFPSNVKLTLVR